MRRIDVIILASLFVLGVGLCLSYGRLGFMPLDDSIVFDGGWRVASGQWPLVDFMLPSGFVPVLIQGLLFRLFGVSWLLYCLHAAVLNGLFAIVSFAIVRTLGAGRTMSWLFGALGAVVFYPPVGVPSPDQHGFFFSALCLLATLKAVGRSTAANVWTAVVPLVGVLGLLSKPIPAGFVVPVCGIAVIASCWRRGSRAWWACGAGVGVVAAIAGLYVVLLNVSAPDVIYSTLTLPSKAVVRGMLSWGRPEYLWSDLRRTVVPITPFLVQILAAGVGGVWLSQKARRPPHRHESWSPMALVALAEGLLGVSALFVFFTNNQAANGIALVFLAVGAAYVAADVTIDAVITTRASAKGARIARGVLATIVAVVSIGEGVRFNRAVNATRVVADQLWDESAPRESPGGRLGFMTLNARWARRADLRVMLDYIDRRQENFFLIGDSSVLYGASGRPSVSPALWYHPGLTIPPEGSSEFDVFERALVDRVRRADVRYVIEEGPRTWMRASLQMFPRLESLVRACATRTVGSWTVLDVCHRNDQ